MQTKHLSRIKDQIKSSLPIAVLSFFAVSCSQFTGLNAVGCKINGNARPDCSAEWVRDAKGNLLVVTWPDGDKSTIRPLGNSTTKVLLNEKHRGELVSNSSFYEFKNNSTGNSISVSPDLAGEIWSSGKVNISRIKSETKKAARREQEQKRMEALYENPIARVTVKQLSEEFESNSIVAEEEYANEMIAVTGIINSVDDSMFDQNSVTVSVGVPDSFECFGELGCTSIPDFSFASVSCSHRRSDPVIRQLRKDMKIEVRGIVYSESTGVRLKNCRYYGG